MRRRIASYALAFCLALATGLSAPAALAQETKEYLVKAAFIYNFIKFTEWPGARDIAQQSHIDVCVLGASPMMQAGAVFKQASTAKLSLNLVAEKTAKSAAEHCHVLFIGASEEGKLDAILAALKGQPVLTVSDIDDFAEKGGMIGFTMSDNKVRLVVNTAAAGAGGLRIDAQLLEVALRVIR